MLRRIAVVYFIALLNACSVLSSSPPTVTFDKTARWTILPFANHTDTPQAAFSAEALVEHLLRARGLTRLELYPPTLSKDTLFEPSERKAVEEAKTWAKQRGIRYAITGTVQEWRYKVGVDGEPAVGLALQVIDLQSDTVVWSAAGAKSGWSREALAAVAQKLLQDLIQAMPLPSER